MAKKRSVKVYGQSGYKYRETPTIMLKGLWLKEAGFDIGDISPSPAKMARSSSPRTLRGLL